VLYNLYFTVTDFLDVNEVNNQLQKHDDEIKLLERDITKCHSESDIMLHQKLSSIAGETGKLEVATSQLAQSQEKLKQTTEVLSNLMVGIRSIFDGIGCSTDAMFAHLGDQSTVNNVNVIQYLSEIQGRVLKLHTSLYVFRSFHQNLKFYKIISIFDENLDFKKLEAYRKIF